MLDAPAVLLPYADRRARLPPPAAGRAATWPWSPGDAVETPAPPAGPLVSIVVPSLDQGPFIEATLRSILLQRYDAIDLVVVDGGSRDETVSILRRYDGLLRWVSEPDRGQADAINKGLRGARGSILAYLNSDDVLLPETVPAVVTAFHRRPDAGVVYGDLECIDAAGALLYRVDAPMYDRRRMIERAEWIPQPGSFWRRELQEEIGLFDVTLHFAMDYDFFIRAGAARPLVKLPRALAGFRVHGESKTSSREDPFWRETLRVSERHGMHPANPWYWIRRLRHHGLRVLPAGMQRRLLRLIGRPGAG